MAGAQGVLRDQVAVVTGGSRGIGAAIAQRLASMGAMVYVTGRSQKIAEAASAKICSNGGHCMGYQADVTKWRDIEEFAEFVNKESRRCDILVNSAGIGCFGHPLHEMEIQDWDDVVHTNLRGAFYCIKAFAPLMIKAKYGHIINISSIASKNALPNGAAYAASKWGLNGLSYSIAEELRNYNIRVSLICPGSTDTGWSHYNGKDPEKMLKPEDISRAVELLVTQAPECFTSEIIMRPTRKP